MDMREQSLQLRVYGKDLAGINIVCYIFAHYVIHLKKIKKEILDDTCSYAIANLSFISMY